jgi:PBP1b-binding outer membrane lipoprotein LpoB
MRIVPALLLALALAGCAKKKAPQSPANAAPATEAAPASSDDEMKSSDAPAEGDEDAKEMRSSDPCEGGE